MNNKFSDIDKAIITAWLFFGAGVGAFVSPLFHLGFFSGGALGLFMGATVAYVLFFEPLRHKVSYHEDTNDSAENEDKETDISKFIHDSFEAAGIDPEAEVEFTPAEDNSEEEEIEGESEMVDDDIDESEEELEGDEEDEIMEDSSGEDSELDETEEEFEESDDEEDSEDEVEEQDAMPSFYAGSSQIHSSYEDHQEYQPNSLQALITPTQLPITMGISWIFISGSLFNKYPKFTQWTENYLPVSFIIMLPAFFLLGLSGLIGILFREYDETLEISTEENATYLFNLLKILAGWGIGLYAILVNL